MFDGVRLAGLGPAEPESHATEHHLLAATYGPGAAEGRLEGEDEASTGGTRRYVDRHFRFGEEVERLVGEVARVSIVHREAHGLSRRREFEPWQSRIRRIEPELQDGTALVLVPHGETIERIDRPNTTRHDNSPRTHSLIADTTPSSRPSAPEQFSPRRPDANSLSDTLPVGAISVKRHSDLPHVLHTEELTRTAHSNRVVTYREIGDLRVFVPGSMGWRWPP